MVSLVRWAAILHDKDEPKRGIRQCEWAMGSKMETKRLAKVC